MINDLGELTLAGLLLPRASARPDCRSAIIDSG
jgi:hypothetical protein